MSVAVTSREALEMKDVSPTDVPEPHPVTLQLGRWRLKTGFRQMRRVDHCVSLELLSVFQPHISSL